MSPEITFTCECELYPNEVRGLYVVTGHDGSQDLCAYCSDCAAMAADDFNGETASIEVANV